MKLFVYGNLLRGEPLDHLLSDSELIGGLGIPGRLFDSRKGFPIALIEAPSPETVWGEFYHIPSSHAHKLNALARLEEFEGSGYSIEKQEYADHRFYTPTLSVVTEDLTPIESGSWRRHASTSLRYPLDFALRFSKTQRLFMRDHPPPGCQTQSHIRGTLPILVTAPHSTGHLREGEMKFRERQTDSLALLLHSHTGCHALYTHWASRLDPNYTDECPFKEKIQNIVNEYGIKFCIDLHGTVKEGSADIYPGIGIKGEFLNDSDEILALFKELANKADITLGGLDVYRAARQQTVTKFISDKLKIPAMQLEIHDRLRQPDTHPQRFEELFHLLREFITAASNLIR